MSSAGRAMIYVSVMVASACSVPIEQFHRPDAAADAPPLRFAPRAYLKASNTNAGDAFGHSVALSADGSTLAVGAFREAGNGVNPASNTAADAGAVYVFARSGATWTPQAYVKASDLDADDFFGTSVALSADGSTLAVGALSEDSAATGVGGDGGDDTAPAAGAVYVFTRNDTAWTEQAYIKASNTDREDLFGISVALSADGATLAVGASQEDGNGDDQDNDSADNAGAVYLLTRSGTSWTHQAYIKGSRPAPFDSFGTSVALSADGLTLAVGASRADIASTNVGTVHVFVRSGMTWSQQHRQASTATGPIGAFGNSVSLSADGSTLAVGASREDRDTAPAVTAAGAVHVLTRSGATWTQQGYVSPAHPGPDDTFGHSVALSADGSLLVVGAPAEDSQASEIGGDETDEAARDAGAAYVFARRGTAWTQHAYVKASNTDAGDSFGASVALASDGSSFAVGAPSEDSNALGVNGSQTDDSASDAGAVYVFRSEP